MAKTTKLVSGTAIIIAIIGLLVMMGFFNTPNIIRVRQINSDYTCPSYLYSSFEVSFANYGNKDVGLCVTLFSDNNITFIKKFYCSYVPIGSITQFKMYLNENSLSKTNNLSLYYNWVYQKNFFQVENHTVSCSYGRKNYRESLSLISEKQIN